MVFFRPILINFRDTSLIIYPEQGVEDVLGDEGKPILSRQDSYSIKKLYSIITNEWAGPAGRIKLPSLEDKNYFISFLWAKDNNLFFDLWKFNFKWNSGPLSEPYVFDTKNSSLKNAKENIYLLGSSSGNTLMVLGLEEKQRRTLEHKTLEDNPNISKGDLIKLYMKEYSKPKNRPELPFDISNNQDFYIN